MKTKIEFYSFLVIIILSLSNCSKSDDPAPNNPTNPNPQAPTVTTKAVSAITHSSASSGGDVTASIGADVTERGVCWATFTLPSISDNKTSDGTGTGAYTSNITGLAPNTTYYVRAYATNGAGTSYGNQHSFTSGVDTNFVIPCTPVKNTSKYNGITDTYYAYASSNQGLVYGDYGLIGNGSYSDMRIEFDAAPETGVYTTVTSAAFDIGPTECTVSGTFGIGIGYHYVGQGGKNVYVQKHGTDLYSITFCNLLFSSGSTTWTFTTDGNLTTE